MSVQGAQDFWLAGSRFYFQRKNTTAKKFPLIDLGTIQPANPSMEINEAELQDSDGGILRTVDKAIVSVNESYEIQCSNLNPENRALLFLAGEPEDINQTTSTVNSANIDAIVGNLVKVVDDNGDPAFAIDSIDTVTLDPDGAASSLVLNTDYEVVSTDRGIIRLLASGTTGTAGDEVVIDIDYTPLALTGRRIIKPQTATSIEGTGYLYYGRENNARQTLRYAEMSLAPSGVTLQVEDYSNFTLNATVLSDPIEVIPAGQMVDIKGDLPARS